jgi:hypothetical protein
MVIVVYDIKEAAKDYERYLGIAPDEPIAEEDGQGYLKASFSIGETRVVLAQPINDKYQAGAAMKQTLERSGEGIHVIALTVDVENLMEHVKKSGEDVITSNHSHSFFVHPKRLNRVLYQLMAPRLSNGTIKAPNFI